MLGQLPFKIEFELAAIVIFIITIFYTYSGRNVPSLVNRIYKILLTVAFTATILNLITVFSLAYSQVIPVDINYMLNYCYLFMQSMLPPILFLYVYLLTEEKERDGLFYLFFIPLLGILLSFFITPMTNFIFYFDAAGIYRRGPGMKVLVLFAVVYLLLSWFLTMRKRMSFNKTQRLAITFITLLAMVVLFVQSVWSHVLLGGFTSAVGCLVLYISLQNPEEQLDYTTGIFNRTAAITMISDYRKKNQPFFMVVLAIDGFHAINEKYGFSAGDSLLRNISKYVTAILPNCVYRMDGDNIAIIFEPELAPMEAVIEKIRNRFCSEWQVGDDNIKISTCICCISCPQDAKTVTEILDAINNTIIDAKEIGPGTIIYASEHIENREKKISELEEQKRLLENITREAEAARIEAERADRTKSIFLANMSHEIRTPMNAILGMTELVLREDVSNQVRENVENIRGAGESLLTIINDILDISKIESGKLEIINDRYFLSSIIHDTVNIIVSRMRHKRAVKFVLEIDHNLPNELLGDELRIRQVLLNLLTNAVKFTGEGQVRLKIDGEVEGEFVNLHIVVSDTGMGIRREDFAQLFESFARLDGFKTRQIEGTGLGLAICKQILDLMGGEIYVQSEYGKGSNFYVNLRQKVFHGQPIIEVAGRELVKPLVILQDESDTQMMYVLKNLGVNATYEIVSEAVWTLLQDVKFSHVFLPYMVYLQKKAVVDELSLKTKVVVIAEFGQYLEVVGYLSAIQKPVYCLNVANAINGALHAKVKKEPHETFIAPDAQILLVDDNVINLKVAEGLLKPYQMQITRAVSGKECLELVKEHEYDLIFLDHMMPGMDGVETLARIRAMEGDYYRRVKVIAFTANAIRGIREIFIDNGFDDYISKPMEVGRLDEVLREHLPKECMKRDEIGRKIRREELLYQIPGVDVDAGLSRCLDSVELYFDLLQTAVLEGKAKLHIIKEYIETGNIKSYMVEVHSLKSVAASIGAMELSDLAKRHEEEARAGHADFICDNGQELLDKYRQFIDSLEEAIEQRQRQKPLPEKTELSWHEIEDIIKEACGLITDYEDEEATARLEQLTNAKLTPKTEKKVIRALNALKILNYSQALEILGE